MGCVPSMRIISRTASSPDEEEDEEDHGEASPSNGVHMDCTATAATYAAEVREGHRFGSATCNSILMMSIKTGALPSDVDKGNKFGGHGSLDFDHKKGQEAEALNKNVSKSSSLVSARFLSSSAIGIIYLGCIRFILANYRQPPSTFLDNLNMLQTTQMKMLQATPKQ